MGTLTFVCVFLIGCVAFTVARFVLGLVFKRLTAHWLACGLTTSYCFGILVYWYLAPHSVFLEAFRAGQPVLYDFAIAGLIALLPLNFLVLPAMYWWDKRVASSNASNSTRIPENALHGMAFCGGLIGAYIGQTLFKHKTSKQSFQLSLIHI